MTDFFNDSRIHNLNRECPDDLKDFMKEVVNFRWDCNYLLENLNHSHVYNIVTDILKVKTKIDFLVWDFLSILRKYDKGKHDKEKIQEIPEQKKGEKQKPETETKKIKVRIKTVDILEEDLSNYMQYLQQTLETTFIAPLEKISYPKLAYISQYLTIVFNSLIGACLLDAWKKSRKEKPHIKYHFSGGPYVCGKEFYCNPKLFYEELLDSVENHQGVFKKQLFLMTKGKIQQAFVSPHTKSSERGHAVKPTYPEEVFPKKDFDLEDEDEDEK